MATVAGPHQFASCDAVLAAASPSTTTVTTTQQKQQQKSSSKSAGTARRSISIFSRRGTETPAPPTPTDNNLTASAVKSQQINGAKRRRKPSVTFASANNVVSSPTNTTNHGSIISSASAAPPSPSSSPSKSARQSYSLSARGTILKAVPYKAAKITGLTSLEEEILCSPNDEILSTIESPSATQVATSVIPPLPASLSRSKSFSQKDQPARLTSSPSTRSKLARRNSTNDRIGLWVNGIAHWDPEPNLKAKRVLGISPSVPNLTTSPAAKHARHWSLDDALDSTLAAYAETRPNLSVFIPADGEADHVVATAVPQSIPSAGVIATLPASALAKFASIPPSAQHPAYRPAHPSITINEVDDSPTDSVTAASRKSEAGLSRSSRAPSSPTRLDVLDFASKAEPPPLTRNSDSTDSTETTATTDSQSMYSKPSSATSADQLSNQPPEVVNASPRLSGHRASRDKPLPPVPGFSSTRPTSAQAYGSSKHTPSLASFKKTQRNGSQRAAAGPPRPQMANRPSRTMTTLDQYDADFMRSSPRVMDFAAVTNVRDATDDEHKVEPVVEMPAGEVHANDLTARQTTFKNDARIEKDGLMSQLESEVNDALAEMSMSDGSQSEAEITETAMVQTISKVRRQNSVRSVMQPPKQTLERLPSLPKKSRKREWKIPEEAVAALKAPPPVPAAMRLLSRRSSDSDMRRRSQDAAMVADVKSAAKPRRSSTSFNASDVQIRDFAHHRIAEHPEEDFLSTKLQPSTAPVAVDDGLVVVDGPVTISEAIVDEYKESVNAAAQAEDVLLQILKSLEDPQDLFHTAIINKGMYRVYKENEMSLILSIHQNHSQAGWEFRQWCPPDREEMEERERNAGSASSVESVYMEHTALTYMRCQKRDESVIARLKVRILDHCSSFVRRETLIALDDPASEHAQRFNDAFWRIWCFCKIFGCNKDREDDITGQLDWLKGGALANVQDCGATVSGNLDMDMSSVLLNAPEYFAKGNNATGLTEEQLYDMTEIWTCLTTLLSGYIGRIKQARDVGIFDDFDIAEGDIENEETILEEWVYYILTLGLDVVLDMAACAADESTAGFDHAFEHGWTTWNQPEHGGSRITFLKEPVSRLYEERVSMSKLTNPREVEVKERNRQRVATLAAEIRLARQKSNYKRLPMIDQANERPMSMFSRTSSTRSTMNVPGDLAYSNSRHTPRVPAIPTLGTASHSRNASTASNFSMQGGHLAPATGARPMRPIAEGKVETFNRQSLQNFGTGSAENTSERAIRRITDMGFTVEQAKNALRSTDMGDGLRVDRAVDLLLRQRNS